jgi:hypothetical protein
VSLFLGRIPFTTAKERQNALEASFLGKMPPELSGIISLNRARNVCKKVHLLSFSEGRSSTFLEDY